MFDSNSPLAFSGISEGADERLQFSDTQLPLDSGLRTASASVNTLHFKTSPVGHVGDYHLSPKFQGS